MKHLFPAWQALSPLARLGLLAGALALLLASLLPHHPALPPTASQRTRRPSGVTQVDYQALNLSQLAGTPQTSYAQAVEQLGEGTLIGASADGHTRTYQWNGGGRWARIEATFRDGYAISESQLALRSY